MRTRLIPVVLLVVLVVVGWAGTCFGNARAFVEDQQLREKIATNEDLETYINILSDYDTMIAREPGNMDWYLRKAAAYQAVGDEDGYVSAAEQIVKVFANDAIGYVMLMEYYESAAEYEDLLALYGQAPQGVQENEDVKRLYEAREYETVFESDAFSTGTRLRQGYGMVSVDGYYGFVDDGGATLLEPEYTKAHPFLEDTAAVYAEGEWFLIDEDGYRVRASHDAIEDLYGVSEGYALACVDGVYGYYDAELVERYHFEYENATCFLNGVAAVCKDGKWALINTSFEEVTGFDFDEVAVNEFNFCSSGGLVFAKRDGAFGLYGTDGSRVGDASFDEVKPFVSSEYPAAVAQGGKWGFANANGELVIACQYDDAVSCNAGLGAVCRDGTWSYITPEGDIALETAFDSLGELSSDGYSLVTIGGGCRYLRFLKYGE